MAAGEKKSGGLCCGWCGGFVFQCLDGRFERKILSDTIQDLIGMVLIGGGGAFAGAFQGGP